MLGKEMNMEGSGQENPDGSEMALLWVPRLSGKDSIWPVQGSLSSWLLEMEMEIITTQVEAKLRLCKALNWAQRVPAFLPVTLKELAPGSTGSVTSAEPTGRSWRKDILEEEAKCEVICEGFLKD